MDVDVERRGAGGTRVPLDSHVELTHEGFAEKFEADGVNVSQGGLAMRAPYLPDVGARLRCRFPGARGTLVEAGAEVVWSSDKGPQSGEFGLRFLDLDDEASRAIRTLLHGRSYRPPAPGAAKGAEDTLDEPIGPRPVALEVDGVSSPIRAGIVSEDEDVLTVSQELPFLRLKTGVRVQKDGRRGRIEGIDLLVDGETPRLMIDIVFDDAVVEQTAESTLPDFVPPAPVVSDDTAVDLRAPESTAASEVDEDEIDDALEEVLDALSDPGPRIVHVSSPKHLVDTPSVDTGIPGSIDEALAAVAADTESVTAPVDEESSDEVLAAAIAAKNGPAEVLKDIKVKAQALWPKLLLLFARVRPALVMLAEKSRAAWGTFRTERAPKLAAAIEKTLAATKRFALMLRAKISEKLPALAQRTRRRRKTAPPPSDSNVVRRRKREKGKTRRTQNKRRRTILFSALAFVGVGLAVWALTPGDETVDASDPLGGHQPLVAEAPAAQTTTTTHATPAAAASAPAAVQAPAATEPVAPSMPRAVGEASREAGPMPAPTFPSLSEGARPQAPQALPEGSPYAVDVREGGAQQAAAATAATEGSLFGAPDVPGGRSYLIRMSQPVTVIRGTARSDGFTVTVPNSLSLDRAGPIAASHPLVERSMILNRGDHAELTITFVEGQSPSYRVSARGSAIEVLIARR